MKAKFIPIVCILFLSSSAYAGLSLAEVSNAPQWASGDLPCGSPITFRINGAHDNPTFSGCTLGGVANGFELSSSDGAIWSIPIGEWGDNWKSYWDLLSDVTYNSATGSLADTIGFSGVSLNQPAVPFGFADIFADITITIDCGSVGKSICIDSAFYRANGYWLWSYGGVCGGASEVPGWDGPHCYTITAASSSTCGDLNGDGSVDVADLTRFVEFLFNGGPAPICTTAVMQQIIDLKE